MKTIMFNLTFHSITSFLPPYGENVLVWENDNFGIAYHIKGEGFFQDVTNPDIRWNPTRWSFLPRIVDKEDNDE